MEVSQNIESTDKQNTLTEIPWFDNVPAFDQNFPYVHLIQATKIPGIVGYQSSNGLVRETGAAVNLQYCQVPADRPQVGILHNKMQPGSFQAGGWWFSSYNEWHKDVFG